MKKVYIILASLVLALMLCYGGYKLLLVNEYNLSEKESKLYDTNLKGLVDKKKLTINRRVIDDSKYYSYKNIKFENIFGGISIDNELTNEDAYWFNVDNTKFRFGKDKFCYIDVHGFSYAYVDEELDVSDYYKKKDIDSNLELIDFLVSNPTSKITDSVYDMKCLYSIKLGLADVLKGYKDLYILDGDITGYIVTTSVDTIEVHFEFDDKDYGFSLFDADYFTVDKIKNILETLVIEEQ